MRPVYLSLVAVALALLSGCATMRTAIVPEPSQRAEIRFERGTPTLLSSAPSSSALASTAPESLQSEPRIHFWLSVVNHAATPIDIDINQITVTANGVGLPVLSYDALIAESRRREGWRAFGAALGAALGALGEPLGPTQRARVRVDDLGRGGLGTRWVDVEVHDPVAAQAARRQNEKRVERQLDGIRATAAHERQHLDRNYFRAQTLVTGLPYTGWIAVDRPARPSPVNRYVVTMRIGEEEHIFIFEERELQ